MEMPDKEESKQLGTDHTANPLNEIERKLEGIEAKLKEKDKEQDAERRNRDRIKVIDEKYVELMNNTLRQRDLEKMIEKTGYIPGMETFSQVSVSKPRQVPQSHKPWGIPREQQSFSTNNAKKDIQPHFKESQHFKENQKKRQPGGVPMERTWSSSQQKEIGIHGGQNIWQFPKRPVTMRQEIPTQVLCRNRFQILAEEESEEKNGMPTGETFENDDLLRDQINRNHALAGSKTTAPKKRMPHEDGPSRTKATTPMKLNSIHNRPGLADQEKQDQNELQTEPIKGQRFGRRNQQLPLLETLY
eukprot:Seg4817.1 transcript_id=Seg4817.1/GoldUCD/mRNA.D3Y31 product="hypothetical protein" protein_id=Seg4817.1/GoldUCD/D3Y31